MPNPLKFFREDPNKIGRGEGKYYQRSLTGTFNPAKDIKLWNGKYFSKYSTSRDYKVLSTGWQEDKVGRDASGRTYVQKGYNLRIPHAADGYIYGRRKR
jgi:hypothetical protein